MTRTAAWTDYLRLVRDGKSGSIRAAGLFKRILTALTRRDVDQLIGLRPSKHEVRQATLYLLATLLRNKDPRLTKAHRAEWCEGLSRDIRSDYPSARGFYQWAELDPDAAKRFVLSFEPTGLDSDAARLHIENVVRYRRTTPAAIDRLKELVSRSDATSARAREALEGLGPLSEDMLAAKARRWRQYRRRADLNWLYDRYISPHCLGTPIEPILVLLGKPQRSDLERDYRWETRERGDQDTIQLMLLADGAGRVNGMKLK